MPVLYYAGGGGTRRTNDRQIRGRRRREQRREKQKLVSQALLLIITVLLFTQFCPPCLLRCYFPAPPLYLSFLSLKSLTQRAIPTYSPALPRFLLVFWFCLSPLTNLESASPSSPKKSFLSLLHFLLLVAHIPLPYSLSLFLPA